METLKGILTVLTFFSLLIAAAILFIVSLVNYLKAKSQREAQPDRYRQCRRNLIASAIAAGAVTALYIGFIALMTVSLAHM